MENQANMVGLKRKLPETDVQRACKVPCAGFNHGKSCCSLSYGHQFCHVRPTLVANCYNFLKSSLPHRIMYYRKGGWCNFSDPVTKFLTEGFKEKKSANEVFINGTPFLVDFLSMVLINLTTKRQQSIAWIDENTNCFFPVSFLDEESEDSSEVELEGLGRSTQSTMMDMQSPPLPEVEKRVITENGASILGINDVMQSRAACSAVPAQAQPLNILCTKIETLNRENEGFLFAEKLFLSGMGSFATSENILHIHRYSPKDADAKVRLEIFEKQIKATEELRGKSNVKYGWYGAGKKDVISILIHGFGSGGKLTEGGALGTGIYLTPESRAFTSVNICDDDEKGLRYMLLCRVVLGNTEEICQGSKQYCPSSHSYDCGVDNLSCPKCYVIWSTHTNTYIHPEYVITFKLTSDAEEYFSGLKDIRFHIAGDKTVQDFFRRYPVRREVYKGPTSPWMSFTMLFSALEDKITSVAKELLYFHYDEFKSKVITREELIKKIKLVVGQGLLHSTLQSLQQSRCKDSTVQVMDSGSEPPSSEANEYSATTSKLEESTMLPVAADNDPNLTMSPNQSAEKSPSSEPKC